MLSAVIERVFQGVDDAASAPTLKAQIELLKTAAEQLEKENNDLKQQNAILTEKVRSLTKLEEEYAKLNQFVDMGIFKIKLGPDGNRLPGLYCPQCDGMITNPEHATPQLKQTLKITPIVKCLKSCGYAVNSDFILKLLAEWDRGHQPK